MLKIVSLYQLFAAAAERAGITADLMTLYEHCRARARKELASINGQGRSFTGEFFLLSEKLHGFASNHAVIGMGIVVTSSVSTLTVQMVRRLSMK